MGQSRRKEKSAEGQATPALETVSPPPDGAAPTQPWTKPEGLSRRGWAVLATAVLLIQVPLLHRFFLRGAQPVTVDLSRGYTQPFDDPGVVARDFWSTGGHWRVVDGALLSPGVKNNPLWLQGQLPRDVAIEFDARSDSPEGDVKVEVFGDGLDHASGYVLIHGGWNNSLSIIARLDEHGRSLTALQADAQKRAAKKGGDASDLVAQGVFEPDTRMRVEARPFPVERGRTYRWRIERRGGLLRWFIDGQPFMQFDDPFPLAGKGHDRMGFSSWESQLYFDNLSIQPL